MKKILVGLMLGMAATASQAELTIVNSSAIEFGGYDNQPELVTGPLSTGFWGSLSASTAGTFSATYLGNESGFANFYIDNFSSSGTLLETNALGTTVSGAISAGQVEFGFLDAAGASFINGNAQTAVLGFAIMEGQTNEFGTFDYIIGFNDSGSGDADYDDFVIGVNFVAASVPEPETYALMLAGIGIVGFTARRRKNKQA